jgi:hypothetical protein
MAGFVPLIVESPAGQGDAWAASELERTSDGKFWDNDTETWEDEVDLSVDWRVPLIDMLNDQYRADVYGLGSPGSVVHTAWNLLTDEAIGSETFTVTDDVIDNGGSYPDTGGAPYLVEAGKVFGDQNLRGSLVQVNRRIFTGNVTVSESATFLMRLLNAGGNPIGSTALSSATVAVSRVQDDDPTEIEAIASHLIDLSDSYFTGLQDDFQWEGSDPPNAERKGYNFRYSLPTTIDPFPYPESRYLVDFTFYPAAGEPFHAKFLVWARQ